MDIYTIKLIFTIGMFPLSVWNTYNISQYVYSMGAHLVNHYKGTIFGTTTVHSRIHHYTILLIIYVLWLILLGQPSYNCCYYYRLYRGRISLLPLSYYYLYYYFTVLLWLWKYYYCYHGTTIVNTRLKVLYSSTCIIAMKPCSRSKVKWALLTAR